MRDIPYAAASQIITGASGILDYPAFAALTARLLDRRPAI
jgi:hypothetical protein